MRGQMLTESFLMLPLFLAIAIAALQIAQLGLATVMTHYAASSIARQAASSQSYSSLPQGGGHINLAYYSQKALNMMVGGIQLDNVSGLTGCVSSSDPRVPTGE